MPWIVFPHWYSSHLVNWKYLSIFLHVQEKTVGINDIIPNPHNILVAMKDPLRTSDDAYYQATSKMMVMKSEDDCLAFIDVIALYIVDLLLDQEEIEHNLLH